MFTLVIGGSASGKSEYAEQWTCSLAGQRIYIATMQPWDGECLARIVKHRQARAHRGFTTRERYTDLAGLEIPGDSNVLLECLSNLAANELFSEEGKGAAAILDGVEHILRHCRHLTIVTNEIFAGGSEYEEETMRYMGELAWLNRSLAQSADRVVEVVCGVPHFLKGSE